MKVPNYFSFSLQLALLISHMGNARQTPLLSATFFLVGRSISLIAFPANPMLFRSQWKACFRLQFFWIDTGFLVLDAIFLSHCYRGHVNCLCMSPLLSSSIFRIKYLHYSQYKKSRTFSSIFVNKYYLKAIFHIMY